MKGRDGMLINAEDKESNLLTLFGNGKLEIMDIEDKPIFDGHVENYKGDLFKNLDDIFKAFVDPEVKEMEEPPDSIKTVIEFVEKRGISGWNC